MPAFLSGPQRLLGSQILCHLSIVPMLLWAQPQHYLIAILVYLLTGCLGMSMTYHRLLAHRSWPAPRWFEYVGTICGTLGLTGSSLSWTAVHRQHHVYADREKDPHSPNVHSTWYAHFLSMFSPPRLRYVADLARDPLHRFCHRYYWALQAVLILALLIVEPFAVVYAYAFPAMLLWNAGSAINTVNHLYGYRNFNTKDKSRNNALLGFLAWGEGWHNNHHAYPARSSFKHQWWEFDLGGQLISLICYADKKFKKLKRIYEKNTSRVAAS